MASCLVTPPCFLWWNVPHSILTCLRSWFLMLSVDRNFSEDFFSPSNGATWKDVFLLFTCHIPAGYSFSHSGSLRPNTEPVACKKHLDPAGHCWGELEAVLGRCGAKEIPSVPWGQVSPARSSSQCQRLTPGCPAHGKEQGHGVCDDGTVWTVPRGTQPGRGTRTGALGVFWDCIGGKREKLYQGYRLGLEDIPRKCRLWETMMIGLNFSLREFMTKFEKVW